MQTERAELYFPARKFRQGVSLAVGEHARSVVRTSAMGSSWFRLAERRESEQQHLRGSEACVRPYPSRKKSVYRRSRSLERFDSPCPF